MLFGVKVFYSDYSFILLMVPTLIVIINHFDDYPQYARRIPLFSFHTISHYALRIFFALRITFLHPSAHTIHHLFIHSLIHPSYTPYPPTHTSNHATFQTVNQSVYRSELLYICIVIKVCIMHSSFFLRPAVSFFVMVVSVWL